MTTLFISLIAFVNVSAFANNRGYDLKMELSMNGKHISSPRAVVKEGEAATVTQKTDTEETFIEVLATEGQVQDHKGILMKFVVGYVGSNGQRTIVSTPQILALESEGLSVDLLKICG